MNRFRPVYLFSDLGTRDTSVGEMKAVMLHLSPDLTPIDFTHEIESYDARQAAFLIHSRLGKVSEPYATVCVVDPGVGSDRHAIGIQTERGDYLIGPDNGCLEAAAREYGVREIRALTNPNLFNPHYNDLSDREGIPKTDWCSDIFHGRDVFAAAVGHLGSGEAGLSDFGDLVSERDLVSVYERATQITVDDWGGFIPFIDEYGNVSTNIPVSAVLEDSRRVPETVRIDLLSDGIVSDRALTIPFRRSFADVRKGEEVALDDSYGYLHLGINFGDFQKVYEVELGRQVVLRGPPSKV